MRLYLRMAWRNIWRHRRRTLIVVVAIGFGLALMMWYDGLIAGFQDAIYGNAIRVLGGNIQVYANGYREKAELMPLLPLADDQAVVQAASAQPQVLIVTRRVQTGGMTTNREGAFSVTIEGIEPDREATASLIAENVKQGRYLNAEDGDNILIGKGLADAMNVAVGDRITLVGRSQHDQMRSRTMTIIGIFDLGMAEIEKRSVYISLAEAQDLYDLTGQTTEVVVYLKHLGDEYTVLPALKAALPEYEVNSWQTNFPELEQAITTKGGVMTIFGIVILGIAAIGILNMLLMAVYERTREIGVLGALGFKPRQISFLFILEGTFMGLVGAAVGILLGLLINGSLMQVGLDYTQFSGVTDYMALISGRLYPTWGTEMLLPRVLTVAIISTLAALYPAVEASHREPAEALHYV